MDRSLGKLREAISEQKQDGGRFKEGAEKGLSWAEMSLALRPGTYTVIEAGRGKTG